MAGMEKRSLSNLLPIALGQPDQDASSELQTSVVDDGQNSVVTVSATDPYLVEVMLAKNVRGVERLSGDYNIAKDLVEIAKKAGLDTVTIIKEALENIGYEVQEHRLRNVSFRDTDLQGGISITRDRVIAAQEMTEQELLNSLQLLEGNRESEEKGLVKLSDALKQSQWKILDLQSVPGKGFKAIIMMSEKVEEATQISEGQINSSQESPKEEPVAVGVGSADLSQNQFFTPRTDKFWEDKRN